MQQRNQKQASRARAAVKRQEEAGVEAANTKPQRCWQCVHCTGGAGVGGLTPEYNPPLDPRPNPNPQPHQRLQSPSVLDRSYLQFKDRGAGQQKLMAGAHGR